MYDLGDTVPLTFLVTDTAGAPAATGAVPVCTVTLPDGSTATPAVTTPTMGTYQAAYVTTQTGRHQVRWVGTGTNASAFTDVFDVHSAAGAPMLFSLAEARAALREPAGVTVDDEELRGYLVSATTIVEDVYGPVVSTTVTQTFDGGVRHLMLDDQVASMVSVTESGSALVAGTDYTVDYDAGILTRGTFQGSIYQEPTYQEPAYFPSIWAFGIQNIVVVFKVGINAGQVVPEHVRKAGRKILRSLWQSDQTGLRPQFGVPDTSMATTPSGLPIPKDALELLQGGATPVGFS